ncbi:hypothetical protein ACFO25_19565 [Paenactinomyces guangxiensis]|uniref:Uncharacterized protein n=1 Tax=Paenactinomyces guangxiensis TaxID=1490290 RepID=A0A7W1WV15_9BACL|nr:hypothetical protein [Paenactinomyces guangxiensis]MBA4496522.1 hypothetical protein [Paenactinomyces guangxiensis]MBH8593552.1 hypothetical protein [Paenactinomyces guangxiensis]
MKKEIEEIQSEIQDLRLELLLSEDDETRKQLYKKLRLLNKKKLEKQYDLSDVEWQIRKNVNRAVVWESDLPLIWSKIIEKVIRNGD